MGPLYAQEKSIEVSGMVVDLVGVFDALKQEKFHAVGIIGLYTGLLLEY